MPKKLNYNNLAQTTNFRCGSNTLNLSEVFMQTASIPGISFSHFHAGGRSGANAKIQADSVEFNPLNVQLLMDDDFEVLKEISGFVSKVINPESGSFALVPMDFWIEANDLKGNFLFKVEFQNAHIDSIDDVQLTTMDDAVVNTLSMTISYDYYNITWKS